LTVFYWIGLSKNFNEIIWYWLFLLLLILQNFEKNSLFASTMNDLMNGPAIFSLNDIIFVTDSSREFL
jgi:hypothetical protein